MVNDPVLSGRAADGAPVAGPAAAAATPAPLAAAIIAGLGNKKLGFVPSKVVTTGALFISCALSWPIFLSFLTGSAEPYFQPLFTWIESGSFDA